MNRMQTLLHILKTALLIVICGCVYPISQEMKAEARQDLTYPVVALDPVSYQGETVIWGGIVIRVRNQPNQTILTVLETPLDFWGVPKDEVYSRGRFMARVAKYLDPEVYGGKKKVTLAGDIIGEEIKPLDETHYRYPVVRVKELHLFKGREYYGPYRLYYYQDGYGYPHDDQSPFKGIR
ncbi:MAG: Slp family lipoprotein [Desulfobacterales bacterium]|nr:MAG: Slp family lipoprotein [Desulfobacterales bacterium]